MLSFLWAVGLLFSSGGEAWSAPLSFSITRLESGATSYRLDLINSSGKPVEVMGVKEAKSEVRPWAFTLMAKPSSGSTVSRTTVFRPYVVLEVQLASEELLLMILPEEKASPRVPPRFGADDVYMLAAGGRCSFPLDFPERPVRASLRYYERGKAGELRPITLKMKRVL